MALGSSRKLLEANSSNGFYQQLNGTGTQMRLAWSKRDKHYSNRLRFRGTKEITQWDIYTIVSAVTVVECSAGKYNPYA